MVGQFEHPFYGSYQNVFSGETVKPCFFVLFNIAISYIFLKKFIEINYVFQKILRFSSPILTIIVNFEDFLNFLVTKNQ